MTPNMPEPALRTETMMVNMGPQHPSTHGVLRLVLELDGETVVSAATTPDSSPPIWLEAFTKTKFTAVTRPRSSSGMVS